MDTYKEEELWRGKPSQLCNASNILVSTLALLILGYALHSISYEPLKWLRFSLNHPFYDNETLLTLSVSSLPFLSLLYTLMQFIKVRFTSYRVTSQRVFIERLHWFGFRRDELELYKVTEYILLKKFNLLIFGLSTLVIQSADKSDPVLFIRGVHQGSILLNIIRSEVEARRSETGVRNINLN